MTFSIGKGKSKTLLMYLPLKYCLQQYHCWSQFKGEKILVQ